MTACWVLSPAGIAFVILTKTPMSVYACVFVHICVWLTGDRGEQGDKGAKGYGLPGYIGDQGPNGKFWILSLVINVICQRSHYFSPNRQVRLLKKNLVALIRSARTSWKSLQWPAREAWGEGTCWPAWAQRPRRSQRTSRCLRHIWVCSAELHQWHASASPTEFEESPVE